MKKEIEHNEFIIRYLNGELDNSQIENFKNQLATDPGFAQTFEEIKIAHILITDKALLDIRNELQTIHKTHLKHNLLKKWSGGIGLSSIIIALVIIWNSKNEQIQINTNKYDEPSLITTQDSIKTQNKQISNNNKNNHIQNLAQNNIPFKATPQKQEEINTDTIYPIKKPDVNPTPENEKNISSNEPTKQQNLNKDKNVPVKIDCKKVKISAIINYPVSITHKNNGEINIEPHSIHGGTPPYSFSLNNKIYTESYSFIGLNPGTYSVYARDANNCVSKLGVVRIDLANNTYQQAFAPLRGEIWTIPSNPNGEGIIKIFTKTGFQVYTTKINIGETLTWKGETIAGEQLPMGVYPFEIHYKDGTIFSGSVTIIK